MFFGRRARPEEAGLVETMHSEPFERAALSFTTRLINLVEAGILRIVLLLLGVHFVMYSCIVCCGGSAPSVRRCGA